MVDFSGQVEAAERPHACYQKVNLAKGSVLRRGARIGTVLIFEHERFLLRVLRVAGFFQELLVGQKSGHELHGLYIGCRWCHY